MCFFYVDNETTKYGLMKGPQKILQLMQMAQIFAEIETHVHKFMLDH